MAEWTDCSEAMAFITERYGYARNSYQTAYTHWQDAGTKIAALPESDTKEALYALRALGLNNYGATVHLTMWDMSPDNFAIYYYLKNCTVAPDDIPKPDPITWKDITNAWRAAPIEGKGDTIAGIDSMRKDIWDEPYIRFVWAR